MALARSSTVLEPKNAAAHDIELLAREVERILWDPVLPDHAVVQPSVDRV